MIPEAPPPTIHRTMTAFNDFDARLTAFLMSYGSFPSSFILYKQSHRSHSRQAEGDLDSSFILGSFFVVEIQILGDSIDTMLKGESGEGSLVCSPVDDIAFHFELLCEVWS